jgi:hypothetical protein
MSSELRMYDEAHEPAGPLDRVERAAEAVELLAMFGLLRKDPS